MRSGIVLLVHVLCLHYGLIVANIFPSHLLKTEIARLKSGDSLTYYQCRVDSASSEITLSNGQKVTTKKKRVTITEKFVVVLKDSTYTLKYFLSGFSNYPNKKFPYLKLKETESWDFDLKKNFVLNREQLLMIAALETKTHPIVHMELHVNKSCPNELIIQSNRINEQFIVEGNYLLSAISGSK